MNRETTPVKMPKDRAFLPILAPEPGWRRRSWVHTEARFELQAACLLRRVPIGVDPRPNLPRCLRVPRQRSQSARSGRKPQWCRDVAQQCRRDSRHDRIANRAQTIRRYGGVDLILASRQRSTEICWWSAPPDVKQSRCWKAFLRRSSAAHHFLALRRRSALPQQGPYRRCSGCSRLRFPSRLRAQGKILWGICH